MLTGVRRCPRVGQVNVYEAKGALRELPLHHRDPFERMLIAQAQCEGLAVVTADAAFAAYEVAALDARS